VKVLLLSQMASEQLSSHSAPVLSIFASNVALASPGKVALPERKNATRLRGFCKEQK
jgi:hypothetical protein